MRPGCRVRVVIGDAGALGLMSVREAGYTDEIDRHEEIDVGVFTGGNNSIRHG